MTLRATLALALLALTACATSHNFVVTSIPSGADVLLQTDTGRENYLGQTPVRKTVEFLGPVTLIVRRAGYLDHVEELVIEPNTQLQRYVELDIEHE